MIICYIGDIGSGKTLSVTKNIVESKKKTLVNYSMNLPHAQRLKVEHIIIDKIKGYKKDGTPITKKALNWDYWNDMIKDGTPFDIAIDELHNLMHSRRAMSNTNTLLSMWVSQIRKVLGTSKNNHFYIITQRLQRIDVAVRDLIHTIIYCKKIELDEKVPTVVVSNGRKSTKMLPKTLIIQYHFIGEQCVERYNAFAMSHLKSYNARTYFVGNDYFKYYDTYELVRFGESVYL